VVPSAPRYEPIIIRAVRELDDPDQPIAETCRRVGEAAWAAGLVRPTYPHLRRIVKAERRLAAQRRRRRDEREQILADAFARFLSGRFVDPSYVLEQLEVAGRMPRRP
jgi:hypothetical protein